MILDENSSSWTATEVDPEAVAQAGLLESATPIVVAEPRNTQEIESGSGLSPGARLMAQVAVVLLSAAVVGVGVFFLVGAALGPDEDAPLPSGGADELAIDPGPGVPVDTPANSSRSGSKRSDPGDGSADGGRSEGLRSTTEDPTGSTLLVAGANAEVDEDDEAGDGTNDGELGQAETDGDANSQASTTTSAPTTTTSATSTTIETTTSAPETTAPTTTAPTTMPSTTATSPTTPTTVSTTSTSRTTTTRATTTQPTVTTVPTTASTTTTRVTTTTRPPTTTTTTTIPTSTLPDVLIAAPADGNTAIWENDKRFRANAVPGAAEYCWTLVSNGQQKAKCSAGLIYDHQAELLPPGPTDVKAKALAADGDVLMSQQITVNLRAADVLSDPDPDDTIDMDRGFGLRSKSVPTADDYCWVLIQGSYNSGDFCDNDRRTWVSSGDLHDAGVEAGSATIVAKAYRGNTLIGRQAIQITVRHDE